MTMKPESSQSIRASLATYDQLSILPHIILIMYPSMCTLSFLSLISVSYTYVGGDLVAARKSIPMSTRCSLHAHSCSTSRVAVHNLYYTQLESKLLISPRRRYDNIISRLRSQCQFKIGDGTYTYIMMSDIIFCAPLKS